MFQKSDVVLEIDNLMLNANDEREYCKRYGQSYDASIDSLD